MKIKLVAAVGKNREIGKVNLETGEFVLPHWYLPGDMKRLKELTKGGYLFMGERTWESLPENIRPLKDRVSIIITQNKNYLEKFNEKEKTEFKNGNILILNSEEEFVEFIKKDKDNVLWIFGGATIYKNFMKYADELYITEVDGVYPECNVFFQEIDKSEWKLISKEKGLEMDENKKPASSEFYYCIYSRHEVSG